MAPLSLLLTSALFLPAFVRGANDWSKPCFEGTCSWDVNDGTSASGGLTLSGSSKAISDITTAAGWELLSCETTGESTTARVVCSSSDTAAAGCTHVEQHGAENKLVRMPPGCGAAPFGRVASMTDASNQTIPSTTARRLHRRAGAPAPQVKELTIDIDWAAIPTAKHGKIEMYITGANVPGAQDVHNTGVASSAHRRRGLHSRNTLGSRGFFGNAISSIGNAVSSVGNAVSSAAQTAESAVTSVAGDAASGAQIAVSAVTSVAAAATSDVVSVAQDVTSAVASAATEAASAVVSAAGTAESAVAAANNFNDTQTFNVDPINFDEPFNLVNQTFGCAAGKFSADLNVNGNAQANAQLTVGIVAAGTIVPPNLSQFQAIIGGNADFVGNMLLDASVTGKFDSSAITLIGPIGLTPFQIPGIFTAGPSFSVTGELTSDLDLGVDMNATVDWNATNIQVFFPPANGQVSNADTTLNQAPLQLALTPNIVADGVVSLHLTPTLDLGLNAFANKVSADIFVDLDAALNLGANATASTASTTASNASTGAQLEGNGAFAGCTNLTTTLSFNAGATGSFFGLFSDSTKVPIFSHTFDLFAKCFGGDDEADAANATAAAAAAAATADVISSAAVDAVSATVLSIASDAVSATLASIATDAVSSIPVYDAVSYSVVSDAASSTLPTAVSALSYIPPAISIPTGLPTSIPTLSFASYASFASDDALTATAGADAASVTPAADPSIASIYPTPDAYSILNTAALPAPAPAIAARSIQARAAARRAESEARAATYQKRGRFAVLAGRDSTSCPPSAFGIAESLVSALV